MLSVDHSNTDGPPLAVKCVKKFGSALGGEVTFVWGGGGGRLRGRGWWKGRECEWEE